MPPLSLVKYPLHDIGELLRGEAAFDRMDSVRLVPIVSKPTHHLFGAGKRKREVQKKRAQAEYYRKLRAVQ